MREFIKFQIDQEVFDIINDGFIILSSDIELDIE